ncbi:MAG: RdgB/HAM1 family non-canonical purine NTP pyrophosphatase [Lachnospiraceae bacterium]|nr:RdgB/HAM1 family non-canonical purine NTP pyrophosphatase [Lachnospiraceae bacterium]
MIIFATSNQHKMREIRMILSDVSDEIVSLFDIGYNKDIIENGTSFEENSKIKAKAVWEDFPDSIVLADDSGLEVDYLDKAPGIYSARFLGEDTSYDVKNNYILEKLKGVPDEKRTARFICAITAVFPDGSTETVRGVMEGRVAYEIKGKNGFGYDPIFYLPQFGCTSAKLSPEDKNSISHRGAALQKIKQIIAKRNINND